MKADDSTQPKLEVIRLRIVELSAPWSVVILSVVNFPVLDPLLGAIRLFLQRVTALAVERWRITSEIFIQTERLKHKDGSSIKLSTNGKEWLPKLGLGVWPDREPPTLWTPDYFASLLPGESPRRLMHQVFRVTRSAEAREHARNTMLGFGTVLQIMGPEGGEAMLKKAREILLPPIRDPAFTCFPFYVPLFDLKTLTTADAGQLDEWSCGATVYVRESPEDNAILILSREPIQSLVEASGVVWDSKHR